MTVSELLHCDKSVHHDTMIEILDDNSGEIVEKGNWHDIGILEFSSEKVLWFSHSENEIRICVNAYTLFGQTFDPND